MGISNTVIMHAHQHMRICSPAMVADVPPAICPVKVRGSSSREARPASKLYRRDLDRFYRAHKI